ncbi:hypothetical protein SLS62_007328 [Diatrype stigma]|uniref:Endonuclease/exonuclease/phosphatase domain-containing protein n=1 Tax=Diatrype stigma TaxID=117547 RepID=A0AAN9UMY6_9PEZI
MTLRTSALASTHQGQSAQPLNRIWTPGTLRIFSWNINGIAPFLEDYQQKSIRGFLRPSPDSGKKRPRGSDGVDDVTSDSENDELDISSTGTEDPATQGKASLRLALRRYRWPHVLFLQEVKIKPGDTKTLATVRAAVNHVSGSARVDHRGRRDVHNRGSELKPENEKDCNTRLEDGGPEYDVWFNLPADPRNAKGFGGKLYGVAAIVRKDFMDRYVQSIRDVAWDREGRVQVIETREVSFPLILTTDPATSASLVSHEGPNAEDPSSSAEPVTTTLAIINIYAVNGTSNDYYNTYTGAGAGTRHDRKLAVHMELLREAHALQRRGFQLIIAGDLNVARDELDGHPDLRTYPHQHVLNRADFNAKFFTKASIRNTHSVAAYPHLQDDDVTAKKEDTIQGLDGIDTFRHLHGSERRYSYYPRNRPWGTSCDRVDLIIASRALSGSIVAAGICDNPRDRGPSDHCPVWAEIGRYSNSNGYESRV